MKRTLIFCTVFMAIVSFNGLADAGYKSTDDMMLLQAQCSGGGIEYSDAVAFVKKLQGAILKGDKQAVAAMAQYPLNVYESCHTFNSRHYEIKSQSEFIKHYDEIMNRAAQQDILFQDPTDIFCNYHGAMIANGTIWFTGGPPVWFFEVNVFPDIPKHAQ